ncbi:MAG: ribosome recycling factor, partial [Lentisphaeraceae bacterium]|nr:ribosome recycling factor [Lentisphaeraceae bacterium]
SLGAMSIPWHAWFSDSINVSDATVKVERSPTKIEVDFRFLSEAEAKKDGEITEDDQKLYLDDIQKLTNNKIKEVDSIAAVKEKELLTV